MCKKQVKKVLKSSQKFSVGAHVVDRVAKETGSPELQAILNPSVFAVSGKREATDAARKEAQQKGARAQTKADQQAASARADEAARINLESITNRRKRKKSSLLSTAGGGGGLGSGGSVLTTYGKSQTGA